MPWFVLSAVVALSVQPPAPALPSIALDSYPAAARTAIARAYDAAQGAPSDADAVGRLGRVLHAWEQWEAARAAYARASALAPKAHEWRYLEGLVLQRLAR